MSVNFGQKYTNQPSYVLKNNTDYQRLKKYQYNCNLIRFCNLFY